MSGGLFGLGKPSPSRFPYPGRPQPSPAVGPSSATVVRANRVIVTGPNGGIYVYSGPPASGNLIESIGIVSAGFDLFHLNAVLPGDTRYHNNGAGVYVAQQSTQAYVAYLWQASSPLGPYTATGTYVSFTNEFTSAPLMQLAGNLIEIIGQGGLTQGIVFVAPSGDTTGAKDSANFTTALSLGAVQLLPGTYYVNAPLVFPDGGQLRGAQPVSLHASAAYSQLTAVAGFSGTSVISLPAAVAPRVSDLLIDCSALTGSVTGIGMTGACYDVHLDGVMVYESPGDGIAGSGYHHRLRSVTVQGSGNVGISVASCTDSTFEDCLVFGSHGDNWYLDNMSNCLFTACRGEWSSTASGFHFTGSGWSGTCVLTGCSTDHNAGNGLYAETLGHNGSEQAGIQVSGFKAHADQSNAVRINNVSIPVSIDGLTVDVGQNPNTLAYYPVTGVYIASNHAAVRVAGTLGATTTPWSWDNSGTVARSGCTSATGVPGSQAFARLPDI